MIAPPLLGVKVHNHPILHLEKLMRAMDQNDLVWPNHLSSGLHKPHQFIELYLE